MIADETNGLFPAPSPLAPAPVAPRVPAGREKRFRAFHPDQPVLLPQSVSDWVQEDSPALLVRDLVLDVLDLDPIYASYVSTKGQPPFDPMLMVQVLLLGYCTGIRSSRALEQACRLRVDFRMLTGGEVPGYLAINRFRHRHRKALEELFAQVFTVCDRMGMVSLATVALDGTKLRASASRHKAGSYKRLKEKQAEVRDLIETYQKKAQTMLDEADAVDANEDATLGADSHGRGTIPDELTNRNDRLKRLRKELDTITATIERIEEDAADDARRKAEHAARDRGDDDSHIEAAGKQAAGSAVPRDNDQRSFSDLESRMMKTTGGAYNYCYNGQAVVDEENQIIAAIDVSTNPADSVSTVPMVTKMHETVGVPREWTADAGYCSKANIAALENMRCQLAQQGHDTDFFIALNKSKDKDRVPAHPRGRIPTDASLVYRMGRKLNTKNGQRVYAKRKHIVEPVFGQIQTRQGKSLLLRGLAGAKLEWALLATGHNILKIWVHLKRMGITLSQALNQKANPLPA